MADFDRLSLSHLDRMTDATGLVQHAIYAVPRRDSGYTTDDNARALRLCAGLWEHSPDERMLQRISTYLSFLEFARGPEKGLHNYLGYDRRWLDAEGCGDCQGQAARALVEVLGSSMADDHRALARELIDWLLPALENLQSLRAQAYVVLAWGRARACDLPGVEGLESLAWSAARRLTQCHEAARRRGWEWFEARLTYANAVLPHALFVAADRWPRESFLETAQATFAFLDASTAHDGVYWPIGNRGWYEEGGEKALFDQQPVEASTMAEAALTAYEHSGDQAHLTAYHRARGWFHGANGLRLPLGDAQTGACYDGLHSEGVNRNQGAESTLAFLWTELLDAKRLRSPLVGHAAVA